MPSRVRRFFVLLLSSWVAMVRVSAQPSGSVEITGLEPSPQGWWLSWEHSVTGSAYTVQFQETLADGIWRLPYSITPLPVQTKGWLDAAATNATRFYRVVAVPPAERGKLLAAVYDSTVSAPELAVLFALGGIPLTPQYSVRLYKLTYETIMPLGGRTLGTGALVLPENTGQLLPLASYQHGTITETNGAPSAFTLQSEGIIGLALATSGYAAVLPDYLGLGGSPGLHPFHHARSEATACVDMLRAVKTFCATNGFPLNDRLFLAGYSQGGHATMALLREIETYHTNEFTVTACAPMAGAYDMAGVTTEDFLSGRLQPNPYYFLYLLGAYQDVYDLAPNLADLLVPPYDTTLPLLLDGRTSGDQINAAMPANPVQILKPEYLAAFRANPRHPLRLALEENTLYHWKPRAPLRLYHCAGDRDVINANSLVAYTNFQALGASQVQLIDPNPTADHGGCAQPSLLQAKAWFDSLR